MQGLKMEIYENDIDYVFVGNRHILELKLSEKMHSQLYS